MTGPGCGWSKISRVRAPYDNLGPAVKPLQSPESAVCIMDSLLAQITGMSPNTIRRGLADLKQPLEDSPYRVRQPGGGRKPVEKKRSGRHPGFGESVARCYGR